MFRPESRAGRLTCSSRVTTTRRKKAITGILRGFSWGVIDVGGIESSRYLEAMSMIGIISAMQGNHWNQASKLLGRA
jgi:hypothetical protein